MPNNKSVLLKYDGGKVRYDLVGPTFYRGLADVLTYGANKYAAYNWCKPIDDIGRLYAALQRHIQAMPAKAQEQMRDCEAS